MSTVLFDEPGPRARRRARVGGVVGGVVLAALLGLTLWKLQREEQLTRAAWDPFTDWRIWRALARALGATLRAASIAVALALLLGMVLAAGRMSRRAWLRWPASAVVEFFRATPVVLLIIFLFAAFSPDFDSLGERLEGSLPERVGAILGVKQFESLGPLVLALTLYNGAVLAEIFRAGILALPRGQREAGLAIGLPESAVMRIVLLPQAVRIMLPALVSQSVVALKDTALGVVIAYPELVREGRGIYDTHYNIIPTIFVVTVIYVTLNSTVSALAQRLQQRQARRYSRAAVAGAASAVDMH